MVCGYNNVLHRASPTQKSLTQHIFHVFVKTVNGFILLGRTTWQIPEISRNRDTIPSEPEGNWRNEPTALLKQITYFSVLLEY